MRGRGQFANTGQALAFVELDQSFGQADLQVFNAAPALAFDDLVSACCQNRVSLSSDRQAQRQPEEGILFFDPFFSYQVNDIDE